MNRERDLSADAAKNSYRIDPARRMVDVRIRRNVAPEEVVQFYARVFEDPAYEAGFSFIVDRRGLTEAPSADTVRAVVELLRTQVAVTGSCRMAIVTDGDAPRSAWRSAEMLVGHYTAVELRVFRDLEAAELWATRSATS